MSVCLCVCIMTEPVHEISNNVVCATSKASDQPAQTRSLIRAFASRLSILWLLLTERHLEFLSLKGGCRGLSESTLVKMSDCWKSHASARVSSPCFHWSVAFSGHTYLLLVLILNYLQSYETQWLSGRALDSKPRCRGFEPQRRHCVVSLSKTH